MLSMSLSLRQSVRQKMTVEQRLESKQTQKQREKLSLCLKLELRIDPPRYLDAIKGLDGLVKANEILKTKNLVGITIGGLARKFWERTIGSEDFLRKDVDVLVFSKNKKPVNIKYGEGGIDWWIPREKYISYYDKTGANIRGNFIFFENMNGAILNFIALLDDDIEPGLYMLNLNQLIMMLFTEAAATVSSIDCDDIFENFSKYQKRNYQKVPSRHMLQDFSNKFIDKIIFEDLNPMVLNTLKG